MNYGELKAQVEDVLGRSDVPMAAYTLMMDDATKRLRLRGLEVTVTLASPYTLPTDFINAVWVKYNNVALTSTETFPDYSIAGTPTMYRMTPLALTVWPTGTASLELRYAAKPADLSGAADTNEVLNRYPAVALYGSLFHFARLTRDDASAAAFGPAYQTAMSDAVMHNGRVAYSGGQIAIMPRATP